MSRVGKKPIKLEPGVSVQSHNNDIKVTGPKGTIDLVLPKFLAVTVKDNHVEVSIKTKRPDSAAKHGLFRSLLQNAVLGVSQGWQKSLELVGVGYKAQGGGTEISLQVGFTHQVKVVAPENISFAITDNTKITVSGIDKKQVGEMAAKIRNIKPPEPYKGKGIRYAGEYIRKKAGKAVKAAGAAA